MKVSILLTFLVITCGAQSLTQGNDQTHELLGRWRSTETSKGGIGTMLFFRADGTVDFSPGAVVEMPYRIEGDKIVFPPATTDGSEQRLKLEFTGQDKVNLGGIEQLRRKGAAPDPKKLILGEWEGKRDMGGNQVKVHYLIHPNGKCLLLIPFTTRPGKYTIDRSVIHLELPGLPPIDGEFRIKDGVLTILSPSRGGYIYSRY
jgi:hypothetical protein